MKLNTINKSNLPFACLLVLWRSSIPFPRYSSCGKSGVHQRGDKQLFIHHTNYYERGMNFMEPEITAPLSTTHDWKQLRFPATYYFVAENIR
jgi:hypothetical protein